MVVSPRCLILFVQDDFCFSSVASCSLLSVCAQFCFGHYVGLVCVGALGLCFQICNASYQRREKVTHLSVLSCLATASLFDIFVLTSVSVVPSGGPIRGHDFATEIWAKIWGQKRRHQ